MAQRCHAASYKFGTLSAKCSFKSTLFAIHLFEHSGVRGILRVSQSFQARPCLRFSRIKHPALGPCRFKHKSPNFRGRRVAQYRRQVNLECRRLKSLERLNFPSARLMRDRHLNKDGLALADAAEIRSNAVDPYFRLAGPVPAERLLDAERDDFIAKLLIQLAHQGGRAQCLALNENLLSKKMQCRFEPFRAASVGPVGKVPGARVAQLSRHWLFAFSAPEGAFDGERHLADVDDASILIKGEGNLQLGLSKKMRQLSTCADARTEHFKAIEKANARFRAATPAQQLQFLAQKLNRPVASWPAILGHDVRGSHVLKVATPLWQADVFRRHVHLRRAQHLNRTVDVDSVADWLVRRYDIASSQSTSVRVAVWDFLSVLERAEYLRRRVRQEFDILCDVLGDETEVLSPEAKIRAAKTAAEEYRWARRGADASLFWAAIRRTGVHVAPNDATMLVNDWHNPKLRMSSETVYAQTVATMLHIPVGTAVALLAAAGVFTRVVT